jgi:nucleoside-diphosphate-sugar epimerase
MANPSPRVVLTGASSFSGAAIARELVRRGCQVIAPIPGQPQTYEGMRARRVREIVGIVDVVFEAAVGTTRFLDALRSQEKIDAICLHHAVVSDYRSESFDVGSAVSASVLGARLAAEIVAEAGCHTAVLTRSVFEAERGLTDDSRAIGLYAISKTTIANTWISHLEDFGITPSNYTITNPIGVTEEPRFVAYLVSKWKQAQVAELRAPDLIRDNIPIDLMAADYCDHLLTAIEGSSFARTPSFWIGSNWDFAERVGREFSIRSGLICQISKAEPSNQKEPRIRIGLDFLKGKPNWSVESFWDEYFDFYHK